MNRRTMSQLIGLGALGSAVLAGGGALSAEPAKPGALVRPGARTAGAQRVLRAHRKAWAREHFRGFENILIPSFSLDLKTLDEAGIRLDVRKSIQHGFFSTLCAPVGLTLAENKRFLEVAVDEAAGRISVAFAPDNGSVEDKLELIAHAEKVGCSHFLLDLPSTGSQDELYRHAARFSEATNLGIYLWIAGKHNFARFGASGIPYELFDKLADLPNMVAVKVGDPDTARLFELFERYNSRMLIGALMINAMPLAIKAFGQQWSGAWTVEALQSPERPYATDFFRLMMAGKYDAGMKLYWRYLAPGFGHMMARLGPMMPSGGHPWEFLKLYQFVVGGNGGRVRPDPHLPSVTVGDIEAERPFLATVDLVADIPSDEAFFVGRALYDKGARLHAS